MASTHSYPLKNGETRWKVRWKVNGDNPEKGGFRTKTEAKRFEVEVEHQLATDDYIGQRDGDVPFGEYAAETLEVEGVRKGTAENTLIQQASLLRVHLLPRFGDRPLNSITYEDVEALVAERTRAGLSPSTCARSSTW